MSIDKCTAPATRLSSVVQVPSCSSSPFLPSPADSQTSFKSPRSQHSLSAPTTPTKQSGHTAASLLAIFGSHQSPTSVTRLRYEMAERQLRRRQPVIYHISDDDSDSPSSPSEVDSPYTEQYEAGEEQDELVENSLTGAMYNEKYEKQALLVKTPPQNIENNLRGCTGSNGRPTRARLVTGASNDSLGISYVIPRVLYANQSHRKAAGKLSLLTITARKQVRAEIAAVTRAKADCFVHANRELFLPLLPEENYVQRLLPPIEGPTLYCDVPQPRGINATMKPYQLKGLSFLVHMYNNGISAILGDEMGLGKTLQTLSLLQYLKEKDDADSFTSSEARPSLVICPLAILENWFLETRKFTPGLNVLRFHGSTSEREHLKDVALNRQRSTGKGKAIKSLAQQAMLEYLASNPVRYDIIVTTYETFLAEAPWFKRAFIWRYLILDEGQKIKSHKSGIARSLHGVRAEYRLLLTGTPLQNNLMELWSLFYWLFPDVFLDKSLDLFKSSFDLSKGKVDRKVLDDSRRLLELIMLRRMKNSPGVDLDLPTKEIVRLFVPLTPVQKKWYMRLLTFQSDDMLEEVFRGSQIKGHDFKQMMPRSTVDTVSDLLPSPPASACLQEGGPADSEMLDLETISEQIMPKTAPKEWRKLLNLVMQLRKICTHPYLIPDAAPIVNRVGRHVVQASGKFMALEKLIEELVVHKGRKMLIFSTFTGPLDWTEDLIAYMSLRGEKFKHIRFDGSTPRARRNLYVRLFQQAGSEYKIFLISTKAGGLGLNLTAATEAVFIDEDWNPQVDLQAEARCHRIGQTQPVTIYKLCTTGTVEEQMLGRIRKKLYLSAKITESMQNIHESPSTHTSDINQANLAQAKSLFGNWSEFKSILRHGARTLANGSADAEELASWDFDTMIENCREKTDITTADENEEDEEKWLSTMERVECSVFDGQRYAREKYDVGEPEVLLSRADRRVGKNVTVMVDGFAINKRSLECENGEVLSTLPGKEPSLAEPKRERIKIAHQEFCQGCWTGREDHPDLIECLHCPRVYHAHCLDEEVTASMQRFNWSCAQHHCVECGKKAVDAGGMIFRCRWCPNGYCEDCLDWTSTQLIGDTIDEYKALCFPPKVEGYYVICPRCNTHDILENMQFYADIFRTAAEEVEKGIPFDMSAVFADDGLNEDLVEGMGIISEGGMTTGLRGPVMPVTPQPAVQDAVPTPQPSSRMIGEVNRYAAISTLPKQPSPEIPPLLRRKLEANKRDAAIPTTPEQLKSPISPLAATKRKVKGDKGYAVSTTTPKKQKSTVPPSTSFRSYPKKGNDGRISCAAPDTQTSAIRTPAPVNSRRKIIIPKLEIVAASGSTATSKKVEIIDLTDDSPPISLSVSRQSALRKSTNATRRLANERQKKTLSSRPSLPPSDSAVRLLNYAQQVPSAPCVPATSVSEASPSCVSTNPATSQDGQQLTQASATPQWVSLFHGATRPMNFVRQDMLPLKQIPKFSTSAAPLMGVDALKGAMRPMNKIAYAKRRIDKVGNGDGEVESRKKHKDGD